RPRPSPGHLPRGGQGDGRGDAARRRAEGDVLRRWRLRPGRRSRDVREGIRRALDGMRPLLRPETLRRIVLPALGLAGVLVLWTVVSQTVAPDLPSPARTWAESRRYVLDPFFKEGEMNQGIGRLAGYSLVRVAKGYALALLIGTPLGFLLGLSR